MDKLIKNLLIYPQRSRFWGIEQHQEPDKPSAYPDDYLRADQRSTMIQSTHQG
jgi:hypothetical protein